MDRIGACVCSSCAFSWAHGNAALGHGIQRERGLCSDPAQLGLGDAGLSPGVACTGCTDTG